MIRRLAVAFALAVLSATVAIAQINVANTAAQLAGKHLTTQEDASTITGLYSFSRSSSAPFAVNLGAALVTNLDADKLDGQHGTYYQDLTNATGVLGVAVGGTGLTSGTSGGVLAYTAAGTLASSTALAANALVVGGGAGVAPLSKSNWVINTQNQLSSQTQFRVVAFHNAAQTVTAGNTTILTLNSEDVDVGSLHDTVTNNDRLTIPTGGDGYYVITGYAQMQSSGGAAEMALQLKKNGTTVLRESRFTVAASGAFAGAPVPWQGVLLATDYVDLLGVAVTNNVIFGSATRAIGTTLELVKLW